MIHVWQCVDADSVWRGGKKFECTTCDYVVGGGEEGVLMIRENDSERLRWGCEMQASEWRAKKKRPATPEVEPRNLIEEAR